MLVSAYLGPKSAALIGTRANKGQGMFPCLQQMFVGRRLRDEPKECLRRRLIQLLISEQKCLITAPTDLDRF